MPAVAGVCALLWLVLTLVLARAFWAMRPWRWQTLGAAALLFTAALWLRLAVPFWPLHSNGHWVHDAALAMRLGGVAADAEAAYGASWVILQQLGVQILGVHVVGLGQVSALLGALAVVLTFAAALLRTRSLPWALLGGGVACCAPLAVRVGHSESAFVVAQLLFASVLVLTQLPVDRWRQLGLGTALALLALGHPLGAGYAVAALLLTVALTPEPRQWRAWLWPVALTMAAAIAELLLAAPTLQHRLHGDGHALRSFSRHFLLWTSHTWLPSAALVLVCIGVAAHVRQWHWWQTAAFALGVLLLARTSTLALACTSDGLRYQAPLLPLLGLLAASAGLLAGPQRWRQMLMGLLVVLLMGELALRREGLQQLDSQGQMWRFLNENWPGDPAQVAHFLVAPSPSGSHFLQGPPVGQWRSDGPQSDVIEQDLAQVLCARNGKLPDNTWLLREPGCASVGSENCRNLVPWTGEIVASGTVGPLQGPTGVRGEFLDMPEGRLRVEVVKARCPAP